MAQILYARFEPTQDPKLNRKDVQLFSDHACTQPVVRFPWNHADKPRSVHKGIDHGGKRYKLEWKPPVE